MTKMEDDQNGRRRPKMEDDQNGIRPKWKMPKFKTTKKEDNKRPANGF